MLDPSIISESTRSQRGQPGGIRQRRFVACKEVLLRLPPGDPGRIDRRNIDQYLVGRLSGYMVDWDNLRVITPSEQHQQAVAPPADPVEGGIHVVTC